MQDILRKYNITAKELAKIFNYSSDQSFYNSSKYDKQIKSASEIVKLVEQAIINKIDNIFN